MLKKMLSWLQSNSTILIATDHRLPFQGYICNTYNSEVVPPTLTGQKIFETDSSIIISLDNGYILKCLKIRHWTEYHKVILGKNRAIEEVTSSFLMKKIGLNVPIVKYHGIFSNILRRREFTSFYAMEKIPGNYHPGNLVFSQLAPEARENLIKKLSSDLDTLKQHTLIYSDLSLRNILVNSDGDYYWIDTQVKSYKNHSKLKFKFNASLNRFIDDPSFSISIKEKAHLKEKLSVK